MGLLEQVIGGVLGSRMGSGSPMGGQTGGPSGMSPLMIALMSPLASQASGHGGGLDSWMGSGPNRDISPSRLNEAPGSGTVDGLSRQTDMPQGELLAELSRMLPGVVDGVTPHGRMPEQHEMANGSWAYRGLNPIRGNAAATTAPPRHRSAEQWLPKGRPIN